MAPTKVNALQRHGRSTVQQQQSASNDGLFTFAIEYSFCITHKVWKISIDTRGGGGISGGDPGAWRTEQKLARSYSCAPLVQHVTLSTHLDFLLDILLITSNKALLLCSTRFATRFGMETRACTCELTAKLKKKHTIAVNRNKQSSFLASGSKQARANNAGQSC